MKTRIIVFIFLFFVLINSKTYAQSPYVLPYPSEMPGSKFYILYQIYEKFEKYWYFGNFASYHYNLKYSDKYLVEAKTLFEYKQFLLAYEALKKSDFFFLKTKQSLQDAAFNQKNIKEKEANLKKASGKHIEVLNQLNAQTPEKFDWKPEKRSPTKIMIRKKINESIKIRAL